MIRPASISIFFFFNDTATTEIYTLSLHDALPIYHGVVAVGLEIHVAQDADAGGGHHAEHHRSEEHTSELQSPDHLVCRLLLEKKKRPLSRATVHNADVGISASSCTRTFS